MLLRGSLLCSAHVDSPGCFSSKRLGTGKIHGTEPPFFSARVLAQKRLRELLLQLSCPCPSALESGLCLPADARRFGVLDRPALRFALPKVDDGAQRVPLHVTKRTKREAGGMTGAMAPGGPILWKFPFIGMKRLLGSRFDDDARTRFCWIILFVYPIC